MKPIKFITGLLMLAFFSFFIGLATNSSPLIPFVALFVLSCIVPMPKGVAFDTILQTWAPYIIERFWKDNAFLKNAYDDSKSVIQGRIVHIPQIGSKPLVQKNRSVFPATAVRRADTDVLYALDEYTTDPTHIPNIDTINLSYNFQDSVLGDHMATLNESVADDMLIKWAANSTIVKTTGASIKSDGTPQVIQVGPSEGQTGNRLAFTHRDLQALMIKMNVAKVPKRDRFVMIDDNMFGAFYDGLGETSARDFSQFQDTANGVVGRLHGFSIMTRSSILLATNADAIKALGAAIAPTDNLCSIAWQKDTVAFAIGDTHLFQKLNDPQYYGDVHSTLVMAGGRVRRADGKGVFVIEQGVPA